jgi:histone H3/H4
VPEAVDVSLVMRRALPAIPLVAVLVVVALTPVDVLLVGRDVREHRPLGFWRHLGLRIARLGHTSIVRGAWMERGGRPRASGPAIEEATTVTDEHAGQDKITDKARGLAEQAKEKASDLAEKAAPLAEKAKEKAGELAEKAAPLAEQAKEKASDAAHKAGTVAAQGVGATAGKLDKATHGKYSGKIKSVSTKLGHLLDRNRSAEK